MTKPQTPAQKAQQSNRTSDGKYATKNHSEADVGLNFTPPRTFHGVLDDQDADARNFAQHLGHNLNWPPELTSYEEFTVQDDYGPKYSNYWGVEPGSSVRLVELRSSEDADAQIVKVEQIVLSDEAVERTGSAKVKHEIDVQDGDDGRPVEAAFYQGDGTGGYDEITDRVSGLLRGTGEADKHQARQSMDNMRDYLNWPQRLTAHDQSTRKSFDEAGDLIETTTRWIEFTEGGNDEYSDRVHVEQTVEEAHRPEGNVVRVQYGVSIRSNDGDWQSEDIFNSVGFDADQAKQVRDHVEGLLLDRSNDADGNSVYGT